ncbi:MAG: HPr(Ser) kinase/phosphatase [Elusimicrobia bacterium]|nr:HPr(Ser) kinase/phosphatase [Elusimicrobiota bacterium]
MEREVAAGNHLTVGDLLKDLKERLRLELVAGRNALDRPVTHSEVNRPGLSLTGYLEHFRAERIQIIGRGEQAYCAKADPKALFSSLSRMLSYSNLPCLVLTRNENVPVVLSKACRKYNVPLLRTRLDTATFVGELTAFLEDRLASIERVHGVLVDVYGLGVLIQGDSGIGKSECALELLKRGHILVADDVVEIKKRRGGVLVGSCPESLRHYMEVRGLGILDVKLIFGIGAILDRTRIELSVYLEMWRESTMTTYERAGLENRTTKVLGVDIPLVRIPVSPGRNLAILIEVAALNQRLRSQGVFSALTFNQKLIERMKKTKP